MVIGQSMGNSETEGEISVIREKEANVITYSSAVSIALSRHCQNACPYCAFHRIDTLAIPYSTIRLAKAGRSEGAREAFYVAGERPDKYADIRSTLNLWGFSSYIDYIYTVAELGFLEGLIPVIEAGFLSPMELKKISEICALVKIMLDSVDESHTKRVHGKSPGKKLDVRLTSLEWAGRLKYPTSTGLMVGIGETKSHRKYLLKQIRNIHQKYGSIHEVLIQNFIPEPGTPFEKKAPASHALMLQTVEMALEILPEDVTVTIPVYLNTDIEDFIKAGVRDFGRIPQNQTILHPSSPPFDFMALRKLTEASGFDLRQRFPLKFDYIKEGRYSKKLGQVFDAYKYKIKKADQERIKELKSSQQK